MSDTDGVSEDPRYDSVMDGYMSEDGLYARNHAQVKYSRSVGRHLRGSGFQRNGEKDCRKRLFPLRKHVPIWGLKGNFIARYSGAAFSIIRPAQAWKGDECVCDLS